MRSKTTTLTLSVPIQLPKQRVMAVPEGRKWRPCCYRRYWVPLWFTSLLSNPFSTLHHVECCPLTAEDVCNLLPPHHNTIMPMLPSLRSSRAGHSSNYLRSSLLSNLSTDRSCSIPDIRSSTQYAKRSQPTVPLALQMERSFVLKTKGHRKST